MLPAPGKPHGIEGIPGSALKQTHFCPLGHSHVTTARWEVGRRAGGWKGTVGISGGVLQTQTLGTIRGKGPRSRGGPACRPPEKGLEVGEADLRVVAAEITK